MEFKQAIYKKYISFHNSYLSEKPTIEKFTSNFSANEYYLGEFIPTDKDINILDIGCGDGNLMYWLLSKGYMNVFGVDISEEQIASGTSLGIPNLTCSDLSLYLGNNLDKFDLIIARDVLEHFTRQEVFDILQLVSLSLKADGKFLIQVPNGQGLYYTSYFYADITHEMPYTESSLRQLGLAANYKSVKAFPVNPLPIGIKGKFRYLFWKYKTFKLRFWKMISIGNSNGIFTANILCLFNK